MSVSVNLFRSAAVMGHNYLTIDIKLVLIAVFAIHLLYPVAHIRVVAINRLAEGNPSTSVVRC